MKYIHEIINLMNYNLLIFVILFIEIIITKKKKMFRIIKLLELFIILFISLCNANIQNNEVNHYNIIYFIIT